MLSSAPRNQPSLYPFPVTYLIGITTSVSAAITTGILAYFIYYLRMDDMPVPGQFIFLIATSSITLAALAFTFFTHMFRTMPPRLSLSINGTLFAMWVVGLGILTGKIGHMVLGHTCTMPMWVSAMGVMVCRIYKALYSFICVAVAASGAAVVLDISIYKEVTRRGTYREMKDQPQPMPELRRGFYIEMKGNPDPNQDEDDTAKLVGPSPNPSDAATPYQTPKL